MSAQSSTRQTAARPQPSSPTPSHVCQLCNRAYERADHLHRHLDSHRNERAYRCSKCPRGFNRRDLLLRHQASHATPSKSSLLSTSRERAIKACDPCVISKLKCDDSRPCQRCRKRKIECKGTQPNLDPFTPVSMYDGRQEAVSSPTASHPNGQSENPVAGSLMGPSLYDHIMAPDFDPVSLTSLTTLPALFNGMSDQDWQSSTNDLFDLDFLPALDSTVNDLVLDTGGRSHPNIVESTNSTLDVQDTARERHAIFLRSPWLWRPESSQSAFHEHGTLPLDERQVDIGASPHQPHLPALVIDDCLTSETRDRIFELVIRTAKSHVTIPRFPSAGCLNTLFRVGLAKRMETDAWIHPYTFRSGATRPELLTALIAAGCVCFGIPSVSKTGLMLFEVVRVALNALWEEDNSVVRDLQYLQASMLWIDVCAFSGFKRKMEVAESNLQPLVTALRRAGKFDRSAYDQHKVESLVSGDCLDDKWRAWVEQESYCRLVHHLFEHDISTTTTKLRNPLISYAELSLPLPASRKTWLAATAEDWAQSREQLDSHTKQSSCLRDLLGNSELLRCLPNSLDDCSARTAYICGLAARVWEHQQQCIVAGKATTISDPSESLWVQTRHQKLYQSLQTTQATLQSSSPTTTQLFCEFLMLTLHVIPDDVTRFAGKSGEVEAHRAYQSLQPWSQTREARTAVVHAARVLQLARQVPPYQLRGADTFLIHHAIMVLWAYAMMHRSGNSAEAQIHIILNDDDSTSAADGWLLRDVGRPTFLWRQVAEEHTFDLLQPSTVMALGVKVLESNYPNEVREHLPQLTRSLCELMRELGSLR